MIEFPRLDTSITVGQVERYLGYPPLVSAPEPVSQMITTELEQVRESIRPKGGFEIFTSKEVASLFTSSKLVEVKPSEQVVKFFEAVEKIAIYITTIGFRLEKKLERYRQRKDNARAHILDAIGMVALKNLAQQIEDQIKGAGEKLNYYSTPTFIPGFGGWDISYRKHVLELVSGYKIGVSLDKDKHFVPQRSTAGIIGWTKNQDYIKGLGT